MIHIINADFHLAALPRQLLGTDFLPLQVVGELHLHRKLLAGFPLIVNIFPLGIPEDTPVLPGGVALLALHIFNISQVRVILEGARSLRVFQPAADDYLFGASVLIGVHIDRLLLLGPDRLFPGPDSSHWEGRRQKEGRPRCCFFPH